MARKKTRASAPTFDAPQSRNEAILQNILGASNELEAPQSRIESLLLQLLTMISSGVGGYYEPSVSDEGVLSWTPSEERMPAVQPANIKGPAGTNGTNGAAAGFGTPTASVDNNIGTPSVVVTASGSDTAKVFSFQFKNLKGAPGQNGTPGSDGLDGTTFTPSVSSAGVISWTNDGDKQNPSSVDLVSAVINALPSAVGVSF